MNTTVTIKPSCVGELSINEYQRKKMQERRIRLEPPTLMTFGRSQKIPLIDRIPVGIVEAVKRERRERKTSHLKLRQRFGISETAVRTIISTLDESE
jgi:hypothetical protein